MGPVNLWNRGTIYLPLIRLHQIFVVPVWNNKSNCKTKFKQTTVEVNQNNVNDNEHSKKSNYETPSSIN